MSSTDTTGVHTPSLVVGGGTIIISILTPSTIIFGSTSIPISSGGSQPSAPFMEAYPFRITSSGIPLVSYLPFVASTSMTLMDTGSEPF